MGDFTRTFLSSSVRDGPGLCVFTGGVGVSRLTRPPAGLLAGTQDNVLIYCAYAAAGCERDCLPAGPPVLRPLSHAPRGSILLFHQSSCDSFLERSGLYRTAKSFLVGVNTSHPLFVTITVSSIRMPPKPSKYTPGSIVIAIPASRANSFGAANPRRFVYLQPEPMACGMNEQFFKPVFL